jgi:hypothetical protein
MKRSLKPFYQSGFILTIMFLAGCSSHMPAGQLTATANPTKLTSPTMPVASATVESPTEAKTVLPPENIVQFQTFEITSYARLMAKPIGVLALCGDLTMQLLQFTPEVNMETIQGIVGDPFCLATSPDGDWIVYEQDSPESPTGRWLIVQSADGQQEKKVPKNPDWANFGDYVWLDNQHLIFNDFHNLPDIQRTHVYPAYPIVVVNPFTGEQNVLSSAYPELHLGINGPVGTLAFNYSDVVYDPSLNLVIFPSWGGEHNYIVLWDRRSQAALAKVENQSGGFGRYPLWSPDATQFVVAVVSTQKVGYAIDEWYRVSREGQVEQLTRFADYFSSSEIGSASNWSPDGQKLAFWIDLTPSPCPGLRLALLNIPTKEVINTCLPGTLQYAPRPIWSLDSRYLIIEDYSDPLIKTILVDTKNGQAFDLTSLIGDSRPIGWLASP